MYVGMYIRMMHVCIYVCMYKAARSAAPSPAVPSSYRGTAERNTLFAEQRKMTTKCSTHSALKALFR